jgi:peptide/nickel transport system permease protein
MITFFVRRFLTSVLVVLISTFVMYILVAASIDPLQDLETSRSPNKANLIANRIAELHLDQPVIDRYFSWLKGVSGCAVGNCNMGRDWGINQTVTHELKGAIATTLELVTVATILAIFVGIAVGLISALRQYTGFDYSITFMSFLLYSLPVFWVAVLAKTFLAIDLNNFLAKPSLSPETIVVAALIAGVLVAAAVGGSRQRRLQAFGIVAGITVLLAIYMNVSDWFTTPSRGDIVDLLLIALSSVGWGYAITALSTGLRNRRALGAALTVAAIGAVLYFPMLSFWNAVFDSTNWALVLGLGVVAIVVGVVVGRLWGGPDWRASSRTAALTAIPVSSMLFVDRALQSWPAYVNNPAVGGRPFATSDSSTPNLVGSFWIHTLDLFGHLLLPTISLILISFASYTRYTRASMLEVMNQDYIRTARSKGLTERTVIMRHAFRNALMPLASIVPVDIITLIGGAIITETVFNWSGMGHLFVDSLTRNQQDPVMAYILIVAILAVVANFVADLIYAVLDPRIRVAA